MGAAGDKTVAVVGGGLAGLAAAVRLADAGYRPTVLESRRRLGGRATSLVDPRTDQLIDNCQHVLLGCCTNLIDLYERLGVLDEIEWHRTLYWTRARGEIDELKAGRLPAPFHLAPSFMKMRLFDRRERRHIARAMWRIIRLGPGGRHGWSDRTFAQFLEACGQPQSVVDKFWNVIVTSACNLDVGRVGAAYALQVFKEGFLDNRWSYSMGLTAVPLVNLYDPAGAVIEAAGGQVALGTSARAIAFNGRRVTGVVKGDGFLETAAVVSAVPFDRLQRLVSATLRKADARLQALDRIGVSPILGVHLWFDQPVMDLPHLILAGHDVQWLFNKGTNRHGRQHLHAVISAADEWMALAEDEILRRVVQDVHRALPGATGLEPAQVRCIKEKRATFAAVPGLEAQRPAPRPHHARGPGVENLYLAGDWCATGWPATMEGAVRSGYAAAAALAADDGVPMPGVVEDVPPGTLARWLTKR
ncbi:MAG: hydroxysqualene dehydroxylase HpnE [Planctomycetota bacterium]|jgi:zeta-carotene desaturase